MPSTLFRRLSWFIPVLGALLIVLGDSKPAAAQADCFQGLRRCYFLAALKESVWERWAMGLDCELEAIDCTRRKLIGR